MRQPSSLVPLWGGILTAAILLIHPACGGSGPSAPNCVDQGVAVEALLTNDPANCSVTSIARVTNNTCSPLQVMAIEGAHVGIAGACSGIRSPISRSFQRTLAPGESHDFELSTGYWCFSSPPETCQLREDLVVKTDRGDFTAPSVTFSVSFGPACGGPGCPPIP